MLVHSLIVSLVVVGHQTASAFAKNIDAHSINRLFVFGNSVSDNGNVFKLTKGKAPNPDMYFKGRYSNGPVWSEKLSARLRVPMANYAFGGATTDNALVPGYSSEAKIVVPSVKEQIQFYIKQKNLYSEPVLRSLYAIEIANNDYINMAGPNVAANTTLINGAVNNIIKTIDTLRSDVGARMFLVFGVAALESTPYFLAQPAEVQKAASDVSQAHNKQLRSKISEYQKQYPNIEIYYFGFRDYMLKAISNKKKYGLNNVNTPCLSSDGKSRCSTPDKYFYWDFFHPTTATHRLLMEDVLKSSHTL
ncbi:GDSL lipase/esterase [Syncephalis fuscata]|nr:GDSL lipase/esterase [Syncephalis fuscata]